jgi:hypothetical protein
MGIYNETPEKGALVKVRGGSDLDRFDFQFNPEEVSESMSVEWNRPTFPGRVVGPSQFTHYGDRQISFELFLYGRSRPGIEQKLGHLDYIWGPVAEYRRDLSRTSPGHLLLILGARVIPVVPVSKSVRTTMWNDTLAAMVARVAVSFLETGLGAAGEIAHYEEVMTRVYEPRGRPPRRL